MKIHGGIQNYNTEKPMFSDLTSKGFCLKLFRISEGSDVSYLYVPFSFSVNRVNVAHSIRGFLWFQQSIYVILNML